MTRQAPKLARGTEEEQPEELHDPLAPDSQLYGKPVQVLNPDGSLTIKHKGLMVHYSSGARVVKR
ncbi:hypothetical protein D9M71_618690 [compost metagenome]